MPKIIATDKQTFFHIMSLHQEQNRHYLRMALALKETDPKTYSLTIKRLKEINREVFESAFLFLTRYIDDFGLQDLIKVLEMLSETRYQDADKMSLVDRIAERVILVLVKIDDKPTRDRLLNKVKNYCAKLDLSELYEELTTKNSQRNIE